MAEVSVEHTTEFHGTDLSDLYDATSATMRDTYGFSLGFNSYEAPVQERLEAYFKGVVLVPERELFIGRIDNTVAGSIQLVKPPPSNQTSSFAASVDNHFVAPWARGYGLARKLLETVEESAREENFLILKLSVRSTREAAINLYESCGYVRWGTLEKYEMMGGQMIPGHFYYKELS